MSELRELLSHNSHRSCLFLPRDRLVYYAQLQLRPRKLHERERALGSVFSSRRGQAAVLQSGVETPPGGGQALGERSQTKRHSQPRVGKRG